MRVKNMTPEQYALFAALKSIAWWAEPLLITPVYYCGLIAGSEFTAAFNANKLYVAFDFTGGYFGILSGSGRFDFYDENNAMNFVTQNMSAYYDAGIPSQRGAPNYLNLKNIYFSRVVATTYNYIKFIGYKLTKT